MSINVIQCYFPTSTIDRIHPTYLTHRGIYPPSLAGWDSENFVRIHDFPQRFVFVEIDYLQSGFVDVLYLVFFCAFCVVF